MTDTQLQIGDRLLCPDGYYADGRSREQRVYEVAGFYGYKKWPRIFCVETGEPEDAFTVTSRGAAEWRADYVEMENNAAREEFEQHDAPIPVNSADCPDR